MSPAAPSAAAPTSPAEAHGSSDPDPPELDEPPTPAAPPIEEASGYSKECKAEECNRGGARDIAREAAEAEEAETEAAASPSALIDVLADVLLVPFAWLK